MKTFFLTLFIFITSAGSSFAAGSQHKIIVALNLNDCINCNVSLYEVQRRLDNPEVNFIFSQELESDSTLVYAKTGLKRYTNKKIIFSDSLYNIYSKGIKSTITLLKDGKICFSDYLYKLNVDKFIEVYNKMSTIDCFANLRKGVQLIQNDETLLIFNTQLKRWTYYDNSGGNVDVIADSLWMKTAYQIYYKGRDWKSEYLKANELVKQYPNMLPEITAGLKTGDGKLLFLVDVQFLEAVDSKNINVVKKLFLVDYNYLTHSFNRVYVIDDKLLKAKDYHLNFNGFFIKDADYLFPINSQTDPNKGTKFLAIFKEDTRDNERLELKEILPANIPNNYLVYNLKNNFHDYSFDGTLAFLKCGEYIYDWLNNIEYPVPVPKEEFDSLRSIYDLTSSGSSTTYYIYDLLDTKNDIQVLYTTSKNDLIRLVINKKTKALSKRETIFKSAEFSGYKNASSFVFKNENQLIYLDNNDCKAYKNL